MTKRAFSTIAPIALGRQLRPGQGTMDARVPWLVGLGQRLGRWADSLDARDYQILFLAVFLSLGFAARDWTLRPEFIATILLNCLLTQALAVTVVNRRLRSQKLASPPDSAVPPIALLPSLKSALITALGLCLLLRANSYTTVAIAASLAILSKFIFRVRNKHCFNPANFGIIAALVLMPDAWVSPGQWGTDWWYALLFAGTGGMVLKRVGRWDTTAAFLGLYALMEAFRNSWLGWTWDVWWHQLMSGSLLLFALFMVTDPRSIPNARVARLLWAAAIAGLTFFLQHQFYLSTAVFWALFALSPVTILLDWLLPASRFHWAKPAQLKMQS